MLGQNSFGGRHVMSQVAATALATQLGCECKWHQSGHRKKVDAFVKVNIHGGLAAFRFTAHLDWHLSNDDYCLEWKMSACFGGKD